MRPIGFMFLAGSLVSLRMVFLDPRLHWIVLAAILGWLAFKNADFNSRDIP